MLTPLTVEEIDRHEAAWRALARTAVEVNPFFEPFALRAVLSTMPTSMSAPELLIIGSPDAWLGLLILDGPAVPMGPTGIPVRQSIQHQHLFFSAPLVRTGAEREFAAGLLAWMESKEAGSPFLRLSQFPAEGPLYQAVIAAAEREARLVIGVGALERAFLAKGSAPRSTGRTLRTKLRRLGEIGPVIFEELNDGGDRESWIEDFLRLEHAGWKGAVGTSMRSQPEQEAFLRHLLHGAAASGQLRMQRLLVGRRPIACSIDILSGRGAFAFKIAHDPSYRSFSPGVLLETNGTARFHEQDAIDWIDSCASPGHPVLDDLWTERRALTNLHLSRKGFAAKAALSAFIACDRIGARLRSRAEAASMIGAPSTMLARQNL